MYNCSLCNEHMSSLMTYVRHIRVHANVPNARFPCVIQNCRRTFSSYSAIKIHMHREHLQERQSALQVSRDFGLKCDQCNEQFDSFKTLMSHLRGHVRQGGQISCPFSSCQNILKEGSFDCHISRYHRNCKATHLGNDFRRNITEDSDIVTSEYACSDSQRFMETEENCDQMVMESNNFQADLPHILERSMALLYLKLQARHHATDTVIQIITDELSNIHDLAQDNLKSKLKETLIQNGINETCVNDIMTKSFKTDVFRQCHDKESGKLRSSYCRSKYYRNQFRYVAPLDIYLGLDYKNQPTMCHYVPILKSIEALFQDDTVKDQYLNPVRRPENGDLEDYLDGGIYKDNVFFQENPSSLKLILYQDSFEVVNPLGSAKKKHKLLAVYYILANLHSHSRSKIDTVQLVLLCKETHFKYFGQEKIFSPLIQDLKILEDQGVVLPGIASGSPVRGSVVFITGDSLGSHCIGGFTENFSKANYICRYCLLKTDTFKTATTCCFGERRDKESYDAAAEKVENDPTLGNFEGVKFRSVFNDLKFFHVCSPGLPPCLAHDLFEGILQYDLALYLDFFITEKHWFTWDYLGRKFQTFHFTGDDSRDRPNSNDLKKGTKLGGQAFQTWCFLRFIPLVIGSKIDDKSDLVWQNLLLLHKIVLLVMSPRISREQIATLNVYIEEYIETRLDCFPEHKLKPKHHFLSHYPELILQFGPLIRTWTMRFESKHGYFKKCVRHTQNFKNLTKTLSNKHQLLQAYYSAGNLFGEDSVYHRSIPFHSDLYSLDVQLVIKKIPELLGKNRVSSTEEINIRGTDYKCGSVIVLTRDEYDLIVGKVSMILVSLGQKVYFVVRKYVAKFVPDMNYYQFEEERQTSSPLGTNNFDCISYESLQCHSCLQMAEYENFHVPEPSNLTDIHEVRSLIKELPISVHETVCSRLLELGVSKKADLEFLKPESDLSNCLSPIQARRMTATLKTMFSVTETSMRDPIMNSRDSSPSSVSSLSDNIQLSSDSSYCSPSSQNWTSQFKIPYDKFPPQLIEACEQGQRPKNCLRRDMVRIMCAEIGKYTRLPGKKNIESITAQLVCRYPHSFTDMIGSEILGSGHAGLVSQILDRMANAYGRGMGKKRPSIENINSSAEEEPISKKKRISDSYGCINFLPTSLPKYETEETLLNLKNLLISESRKLAEHRNAAMIKEHMAKTYILQRRLINKEASIANIYKEWPLLFEPDCLLDHFKELTGIDLTDQLNKSLQDKAKRLMNFIEMKRKKTKGVENWLAKIKQSGCLMNDKLSLIFPLIATALGEDADRFIKEYEETTNVEEIESKTTVVAPHMAVVGDILDDRPMYFLVIEKRAVSRTDCFDLAVAITFAAYYIFNLQYDASLSSTLEFIQRCFVKLNPARGTKSQSKKTGLASNKVVSLINAFQQFEWNID